jgi:hypothetical protein
MPAGTRAVTLACSTALLLATGCTSPEQKRQAATEAVRSWEATLRLTREQLERGSIPRRYTHQILQAAQGYQRSHQERSEWRSLPRQVLNDFAIALDQLSARLNEGSTSHAP